MIPAPANTSFLEIFTMDGSGAMDANGVPTSQVRLQTNTNSDFNPRYSADGTQITFIKDPLNNGQNSVWKMDADGSNEVAVTSGANDSFVGGWSPDGTKIVFQRLVPAAGGNPANFEVFVVNADGTGLTNLTNNPGSATVGSSDSQPSWSPDGTRIAFQSNRLGNPDIWVMDADGSNPRPLTADSLAEESQPEFSPDGQQIAFQSDRGMIPRTTGRNLEIYRMNAADGSNVTRLTFSDYNPAASGGETTANLSGYDVIPHWSPEGDRIVFHSGRAIEFGAAQWDVFTINSAVGENPIGGTPALRLTARDRNDERCGWSVDTPHNLLSVVKAGSGEGTVTSGPDGIDCGADCAEGYADNTVVTLTAAPAANGSTFVGFTGGGCSGAALTCDVTVDDAKTVTATFADASPALTVTKEGSGARKAGTGEGTVTSAPAGIDCGVDCTEEYAAGTEVTLTATPAAGSTFDGFTGGGCTGTGTTCTVTVDAAKTVTAIFSGPLLTVTKAGEGAGTVTSNPLGISCGVDCSEDYEAGTAVTLTASVSASTVAGGPGATFGGFTGCASTPTATTCTVTMDQARNVVATFVDNPTLTVTKAGTGTGTVTSSPAGLSCGATCTRDFPTGSTVTLTAAPAAASAFTGFTGCTTTPTPTTCTVEIDQAKAVTARFIVPRTLSVTMAGNGSGTVTSAPSGINCGSDCSEDYDDATSVTLTASADTGSSFTGFTGAGCSGSGTICTVTMGQAEAVTATFVLIPRTLTVTLAGAGSGSVTSAPAGINCGTDCTQDYENGTSVTLTAAPAAGSTFSGFTGAGCSGTGTTCTVTMDQARSVRATFGRVQYPLPQTPPPPPPPPGPDTSGRFTAKLSLARATINRDDRVLDVLAPITSRASGRVNVELHAAGRRFRFTARIDSANGRIRFRQRIPAAQARLGTGIITITYAGDADTRPQSVRLRAAFRPAALRLERPRIVNGRIRASGTVSDRARGVVRLQLEYDRGGETRIVRFRATISNGRWSLNERLSATELAGIAQRRGTVHSYTLFTGYLPARMRGEMRSFQVLGNR